MVTDCVIFAMFVSNQIFFYDCRKNFSLPEEFLLSYQMLCFPGIAITEGLSSLALVSLVPFQASESAWYITPSLAFGTYQN